MRCMAEAHHSANYDQAFPCRHSGARNGKSLFSHTPMEAMGHGAMQMRCVYTHVHKYTDAHTHTNTSKHAASLTLHARTVLTPTHTLWCTELRKHTNTHNHHLHYTSLLMHVASHLYIPTHTNTHLSLSPSLIIMLCHTHTHAHTYDYRLMGLYMSTQKIRHKH